LSTSTPQYSLRSAVAVVATFNLARFGVEFSVALSIGSVSLFADSINFPEDTFVNILIFSALGWSAYKRSIVGMLLAALLRMPGVATLWTAWEKFGNPIPPDAISLSVTGAGVKRPRISGDALV
jgi:Co/Zn/Cd efflux system component